jgi:hypothetical protein
MYYVKNTNFITNPKVCLSAFLIPGDNYNLSMGKILEELANKIQKGTSLKRPVTGKKWR